MASPQDMLRAATIHYQKGEYDRAEPLARQALAAAPGDPLALSLLGDLRARAGCLDEAIALQQQVVERLPQIAAAHYNLGNTLKARGRLVAAAGCFQRAIELQPGLFQAYNNLGNVLQLLGRTAEAMEVLQACLKLAPGDAVAHNNLGHVFKAMARMVEAEASYRRAVALAPEFAEAWNNLADLCHLTGRAEEAAASVARACALAPHLPIAHSNRINIMLFNPATTTAGLRRELEAWRVRFAQPLKAAPMRHGNTPDPQRVLRVGYMSPDFRDHVVGRNMLPLFREHDPARHAIYCYSDVAREDALTAQFRALATGYVPTAGLTDEELAARIRQDGIDILVDLALHLGNRLLVFARKPAPVQVTFAGYPGSTGLDAIDYRLTDPHLDPPGTDGDYIEASIRLPSFWCYESFEPAPEPGPPPALASGRVTFGCLNNFCKVHPPTLALWARVLAAVPGSRLLLLADEGPHRAALTARMEGLGITAARIAWVGKSPRAQYLGHYQQVDINLDTLPYNGHTTSLDGLYMGVPLVSLPGATVVGRGGVSMLTNLGLPELLARSEEEFVRIAVGLAGDLPRLAGLRASLRGRMERSVLMDAAGFARSIEGAYRQMWRKWCGVA